MRRALVTVVLSLLSVATLAACGGTNQSAPPVGTDTTDSGNSTISPTSTTGADVTGSSGSPLTDTQVSQLETDVNSVQGTVDQLDQLSSEQ